MLIEINGRPQEVPDGSNVAALLEHLTLEPRRVAVELNKRLVPRGMFDATSLAADDHVEIVTLVGGG